jgi:hypothetical protein
MKFNIISLLLLLCCNLKAQYDTSQFTVNHTPKRNVVLDQDFDKNIPENTYVELVSNAIAGKGVKKITLTEKRNDPLSFIEKSVSGITSVKMVTKKSTSRIYPIQIGGKYVAERKGRGGSGGSPPEYDWTGIANAVVGNEPAIAINLDGPDSLILGIDKFEVRKLTAVYGNIEKPEFIWSTDSEIIQLSSKKGKEVKLIPYSASSTEKDVVINLTETTSNLKASVSLTARKVILMVKEVTFEKTLTKQNVNGQYVYVLPDGSTYPGDPNYKYGVFNGIVYSVKDQFDKPFANEFMEEKIILAHVKTSPSSTNALGLWGDKLLYESTKEIKKVTAKQNIYMRGILIAVKQITYTSNDIKVKDKTTNN